MARALFCAFVIIYCVGLNKGQDVRFQEVDFSNAGDVSSVVVERRGATILPISVTVRPLTVSQYQASVGTGCSITPGEDHAETDDFNSTELTGVFPANSLPIDKITFPVAITVDNVLEAEEIFVIVLEVTGGGTSVMTSRNCTIVRIQDNFFGQILRWTHNGAVVDSSTTVNLQEAGSQTIITAERLVETEVTITISTAVQTAPGNSDFTLDGLFTLPPERSSVDVVMNVVEDTDAEDDVTVNVTLMASATGIFLSGNEISRMVTVNIQDNDELRYTFVNADSLEVTEGDSVTIQSSLNPAVSTGSRSIQQGRIQTQNGTAIEGTDFEGVDELVNVSDAVNSLVIRTIFRPGAQSRRSFTVYLLPDASLFPTHSQTLIQGTVTINILDNSTMAGGVGISQDHPLQPSGGDRVFVVWVAILCVGLFLLCCVVPLIFLLLCCWCRRNSETAYYPRKSMKMLHKGNGSSSAIHDVEEVYIEEQNRDLKFL